MESDDVEVVDGEPVLDAPSALAPLGAAAPPVAGAPPPGAEPVARPGGWRGALATTPGRQAAMAATSFVAGAAVLAVFNHKRSARPVRLSRGSLGDIVGTDHYLIDVHRLRRS